MIKEAQSKQEKDIIGQCIRKLAQNLSEQDALILKYLYEIAKQSEKNGAFLVKTSKDTVNAISNMTNVETFAVRLSLMRLEDKCFVNKRRKGHFLRYEITDDGAYALNYLMNSTNFPGRKEKFDALLSEKKDFPNVELYAYRHWAVRKSFRRTVWQPQPYSSCHQHSKS